LISIGLTGGIGAGKSTVARIFNQLGIPIFNSDDVAKESYFDPEIQKKVIELFGNDVYENGSINRIRISELAFKNTTMLQQLEAIIHPWVHRQWDIFVEKNRNAPYIIQESAIFKTPFSKKIHQGFVGVVADSYLKTQRVKERSNLSESEISQRMSHQISDTDLQHQCDWIITNNMNDALLPQVMRIHQEIISAFKKDN
jgi:dephospho-CoA kinase